MWIFSFDLLGHYTCDRSAVLRTRLIIFSAIVVRTHYDTQPLYQWSDNDDRLIIITLISRDVRYSSKIIPLASLYTRSDVRFHARHVSRDVMRRSVVLKSIGCPQSMLPSRQGFDILLYLVASDKRCWMKKVSQRWMSFIIIKDVTAALILLTFKYTTIDTNFHWLRTIRNSLVREVVVGWFSENKNYYPTLCRIEERGGRRRKLKENYICGNDNLSRARLLFRIRLTRLKYKPHKTRAEDS